MPFVWQTASSAAFPAPESLKKLWLRKVRSRALQQGFEFTAPVSEIIAIIAASWYSCKSMFWGILTSAMENETEKKMEHKLETTILLGYVNILPNIAVYIF